MYHVLSNGYMLEVFFVFVFTSNALPKISSSILILTSFFGGQHMQDQLNLKAHHFQVLGLTEIYMYV